MLSAVKYRLEPTKLQEVLLNKHFGACRKVYNHCLAVSNTFYQAHKDNPIIEEYTNKKGELKTRNKKSLDVYELKKLLPVLKATDMPYLKEVGSLSLQQSVINLDNAFQRFFSKELKSGRPCFKSRHDGHFSFTVPQNTVIDFDNSKVRIPKFLDGIKAIIHRKLVGTVKSSTISKNPSGQYFISILIDDNKEPQTLRAVDYNTTIGVDLGIKDFAICSNKITFKNPKFLKCSLPRLKRLGRKHSRKIRFAKKEPIVDALGNFVLTKKKKQIKTKIVRSKNMEKSKLKLAKAHKKVANQRQDFTHQVSAKIANDNQISCVCVETLKVKNMIKNRKLSRAIADVGWSGFITKLEYKLQKKGKTLVKIDSFFPSSKQCLFCGIKNTGLTLKDRVFNCIDATCENNFNIDRDFHASLNIKLQGLKTLLKNTVGTTEIQACGADVRPSLTWQLAVKQEALGF